MVVIAYYLFIVFLYGNQFEIRFNSLFCFLFTDFLHNFLKALASNTASGIQLQHPISVMSPLSTGNVAMIGNTVSGIQFQHPISVMTPPSTGDVAMIGNTASGMQLQHLTSVVSSSSPGKNAMVSNTGSGIQLQNSNIVSSSNNVSPAKSSGSEVKFYFYF